MAETTFVDFDTMANAVASYIKLNNLTKIEYVQDLNYVGVICLENRRVI